jgi:hypothetical protein
MKGNDMPLTNDIRYFQRREAEERLAAQTAPTAALKELLEVIADRYADWIWSLEEKQFEFHALDSPTSGRTILFEPDCSWQVSPVMVKASAQG